MSISETSGNEETIPSNDKVQLLTVVQLLRLFKRPFKFAHIDVYVREDLDSQAYYEVKKNKNRFKVSIHKTDKPIQASYPELALAWASMITSNIRKDTGERYPDIWGKHVVECWRILMGETTGRDLDELRSKLK